MLPPRTLFLVVTGLALSLSSAAAEPAGLKGAGPDAERWLTDNADFVVAINVKRLAASEVMTKGGADAFKEALKAEPKMAAAFEAAGIDPLADVDSVLFSGTVGAKAADAKGVVVVSGRFDADKVFEAAKKKDDKVKVLSHDNVPMLKFAVQDHDAFAAFAGKRLVITQSQETTAAWAKDGGRREAKMSAAMKTALDGFKGTEAVTFAMVLNDDVRKMITRVPQLAVAGSKLLTLTAALSVTDHAALEVVAGTSEAKAARQVQAALNVLKGLGEVMVSADDSFPPALGEILNEIKIALDGTSVRLTLKVDKALLEKAGKKKSE